MNKWFGMKGLAVGLGVIILVVVVGLFLIDSIIEKSVEKYGTQAVGARVDLAEADLSLLPLGITLTGLEVTNPDSPMENAVQVATLNFALDIGPLLDKQVIIDDMTMDRVQFNTPRSTSGAVPGLTPTAADKEKAASGCGDIDMPALELSDVGSILSGEKLESLEAVQRVKADIAARQDRWKQQLAALPDEKKLASYRTRIEKLTSGGGGSLGGLLSGAGDIQNLQKEIEGDLNALKNAQNNLNREVASLGRKVDSLAANPMADVNRLAKKYGLSSKSLGNMSRVLLGDQMCQMVQKALGWYDRMKKPGAGQKGPADEGEKAASEIPFVLVRNAKASVVLKSGTIQGVFKDITTKPEQLGKPTTFELAGKKLDGLDLINVLGSLDMTKPGETINTVKGVVKGYLLENFKLPAGAGVPIIVKKALADLEIDSSLKGEDLAAIVTTALKNTSLAVDTSSQPSPVVKALGSALEGLSTLTATADVTGTLENYIVKVKSDVDRILKSAMGKVVGQQTAALKKQLKAQISAQLQGPAGEAKQSLGGFGDIQGELEKRLNLGNGLMGDLKLPF